MAGLDIHTKMCASVIPFFPPMKQQKSTFNSYYFISAVNLKQNMVNLLFIVHILCFPSSRLARKNMLEKWTKRVVSGVCRSGETNFD